MNKINIFICIFFILFNSLASYAQSDKEKAYKNAEKAIQLEDEGKIEEAIKLLKVAQKLDPENYSYPYEIGYAYYVSKDYNQAKKYLEETMKFTNVSDLVFQLLGNTYDNLGNTDKAVETYENGLKKFPNSGNLYLELGVVQLGKEDYDKAIYYFEKGIDVAPKFPSNYYWAAKLYCHSKDEVWGMIYGEIFMNLERGSKRTEEISKLLYDTYKSGIKIESDTNISVSFCENAVMSADALNKGKKFTLPFGMMAYEQTIILSLITIKTIDLNSLDIIRRNFVECYYKNKLDKNYPNILFDYQKKINDLGHMEAYNHWLLMKGHESQFNEWQAANKKKWDQFIDWYKENPIQLDNTHKFIRSQYE